MAEVHILSHSFARLLQGHSLFHSFGISGLRSDQTDKLVDQYQSDLARRRQKGEIVRSATHLVWFTGECDVFNRQNELICTVTPGAHAQRVIDCANKVALALGVKQLALAPMHPRCHYSVYQHEDPSKCLGCVPN